MREYLPGKYFDVFLDIARFGMGKAHDNLEESLAIWSCLRNGEGAKTLEVATYAIFLLHGKAYIHELLQKIYRVYTCDEALVLFFPPDTADADTTCIPTFSWSRLEGSRYGAAILRSFEPNKPPFGLQLFLRPIVCHLVKISVYL